MNDIETTDIKISYTVSRVLRTLLNTVFENDEEDRILTFVDKELLDDILRYGTIAEVARRKNIPASTIRTKLSQSLSHLENKIKWIEIQEHQLKHELVTYENLLKDREKTIRDLKKELSETKTNLRLAQFELSNEKDLPTLHEENQKQKLVKSGLMQREHITLVREILYLHTLNRKIQEELGISMDKVQKLEVDNAQLLNKIKNKRIRDRVK